MDAPIQKAAEDSRTPKRFAHSGALGGRASVLECGCPLPLWTANAYLILRHHTSGLFRAAEVLPLFLGQITLQPVQCP